MVVLSLLISTSLSVERGEIPEFKIRMISVPVAFVAALA